MKIKITMIDETIFEFENPKFDNLIDYISDQLTKDYSVVDIEKGIAIRCSNILLVEGEIKTEAEPKKFI